MLRIKRFEDLFQMKRNLYANTFQKKIFLRVSLQRTISLTKQELAVG